MQKFAIYDLDRTILRTPTFTLFLFWAAATNGVWRLLLTPFWLLLALGHALHLYDRSRFKPAAISLLLGRSISAAHMQRLAQRFSAWRIPANVAPGAQTAMDQDRRDGYRLIMATAAPEFYAEALGRALGFEAVIASRHQRGTNGEWLAAMDGANCYGAEKGRRVATWLSENDPQGARHIRAYSDHPSDAALFALADEAILIGRGKNLAALAHREGWELRDFSKA